MKFDATEILRDHADELRNKLETLLSQCEDTQVELFDRMYGSIIGIEDEQIPWAIKQVVATINKNAKLKEDNNGS